jgi:hypothetical protein
MIEIRAGRVSADTGEWRPHNIYGTTFCSRTVTYYSVWLDGKRVDQFLSKGAAERKAREYRNRELTRTA